MLAAFVAVPGCTGRESESGSSASNRDDEAPDNDRQPGGKPSPSERERRAAAAGKTESPATVWVDEDGRKHFGKVPYDVFHDDPLVLARDLRPVGGAPGVEPGGLPAEEIPTVSPSTDPAAPPEKTVAGGAGDDWKSIAPMPVLEAEVKNIRNFIAERMQTVGRFNGAYKEVSFYGSTLAAVAAIISRHPDPLSWKEDARSIRDLGMQIQDGAIGLGRKHYDETQVPFENLVSLLNRNKPPGLPEPEDAELALVAERGGLMKRMEKAFNWMHKNITTEDAFKKQTAEIAHEATILAALSKAIGDKSYFLADDEGYKGYVAEMLKSSLQASEATKTGNFETFRAALDRINNTCTQCHTDYR